LLDGKPEEGVIRSPYKLIAALCFCLSSSLSLSGFAHAQEDLRARGDRACNHDARRYCRQYLGHGDSAVLACFQANEKRLSSRCRKFLIDVGQLY
jgi:hypothetical protein